MPVKPQPRKHWTENVLGTVALLAIAFTFFSLTAPIDPETLSRFSITPMQLRMLQLPLILMVLVIWFSLSYGFVRFKSYALTIIKDKDGRAFNLIANALGLLGLQIILPSLLKTILTRLTFDERLILYISTYLGIVLGLAGYYYLLKGGQDLEKLVKVRRNTGKSLQLAFIVFLALYAACAILLKVSGINTQELNIHATLSFIPWLITILLPTLLSWHLGLMAFLAIYKYKEHVKGIIYENVFSRVTTGIFIVIISSIGIQALGALGSTSQTLGLGSTLVVVYGIIGVFVFGYYKIADGAKNLQVIEEV